MAGVDVAPWSIARTCFARSATATATGFEPQMTICGRGSTGSTKMCPSQGTMERAVFWLPASAAKSKCPASALTGTRPALVLNRC
jgi:hypothetical protein